MQRVTITSTRYHTRYHTRYRIMEGITITSTCYHMSYHTFYLSLAWFRGYFQRVTTRYRQIYYKNVY